MMTKKAFDAAQKIRNEQPGATNKEIRDQLVKSGAVKGIRLQPLAVALSFGSWEEYKAEMERAREEAEKPEEPEMKNEKKPEAEKPADRVKIIMDDKAVIQQLIELNKTAWKVLHMLNAALTGEAEIE